MPDYNRYNQWNSFTTYISLFLLFHGDYRIFADWSNNCYSRSIHWFDEGNIRANNYDWVWSEDIRISDDEALDDRQRETLSKIRVHVGHEQIFQDDTYQTLTILIIFDLSKNLAHVFVSGQALICIISTLSNPNSKFLEFGYVLCAYKGAIIFLDLLILPIVPRDPPIFLILGCAKILLSPMQYFWIVIYSFSCLSEE